MDSNNLQVRWKHHQIGVMDYLRQLLASEMFVDVTLCCQSKRFKAHRVLLSACSSYLQKVLVEHLSSSDHVTIILPDIHPEDMQCLLDFMYTGSVGVPRCRLASFLQAAEALHIKVLTDMAQKQKTSDSENVICVPAYSPPSLDVKLASDNSFHNRFESHGIKADNSSEVTKLCRFNDGTNTPPNDSKRLLSNKTELKDMHDDKNSCMYKCPLDNLPYITSAQTPLDPNCVSNRDIVHNSFYGDVSKRTVHHGDLKESGKSENFDVLPTVPNQSNTKPVFNSIDHHEKSLGSSTESVVSNFLESSIRNKTPCDVPTIENTNCNGNPAHNSALQNKIIPTLLHENEFNNDRTTMPEEICSPTQYGLQPSSNNGLHIITKEINDKTIPNNHTHEYRQDKLSEELIARNPYRGYLPESSENYSQHLQRLAQLPKPIPSLMPISNNNYQYNGQIPTAYFNKDIRLNGVIPHNQQFRDTRLSDQKDVLPEHLQNIKNIIPSITSTYQTCDMGPAAQRLMKDNKCMRSVWFQGKDKLVHMNGQRPISDAKSSVKRLSQRVPRLSPIVPPSPWAQNNRLPCVAPMVCPPRGFPYQAPSWITPHPLPHALASPTGPVHPLPNPLCTTPSHQQQTISDLTRPATAAPAPNMASPENMDASLPAHSKTQTRPESNHVEHQDPTRKRSSESLDVFCRLKERRLQEFYKEQMTIKMKNGGNEASLKDDEVASDLSTKYSQSPRSISARSSPCDYGSPLTPSLQQKLKSLSDLTSSKLSAIEERIQYKENLKEEDFSNFPKNCDIITNNVEVKTEQVEEQQPGNEQNGGAGGGKMYSHEDDDVQILNENKPIFTKNDSNNNNGVVVDEATPAAKNHGCEDCGKCFSRRQLLVQHRRIHTGERPYSCADCGRQFTQRGHWSTHQKLHEPARRPEHACPSCGKAFVTRASLKVHLRTHTGEKPFQCGECGKQFSQLRNYKYHRSVHEGTREFAATCPECGKYFNDRGYLSSHMKIHRNRKEYGCQYCGKSFNQRVAYNMHVRIHTGERPHSCPHCNKSFSRKMLLKQHLRIHTGEKPFACSVCGKAFADRSNMTLHMRLHSGIKPYSCQLCSKAFTKKHHLKTHLNYHTGTKPYSCSKCGLRFSQSSNMRTHYKKCTSTGPVNLETPVNNSETLKSPVAEGNGATSPSSSLGHSDVTVNSAAVITPPHSDESSCGSSVIPRNAIEAQPA